MKLIQVSLDKIEQNENSRVLYRDSDMSDLIFSMRTMGLLQPVGLKQLPGGNYETVFGNRRIISARKLGWDKIDATIVDRCQTQVDLILVNLTENLNRKDTTTAEEGRTYILLMELGLTLNEIAARLGISKRRVEIGIKVFGQIPQKYHGLIVNNAVGAKAAGKIAATSAHEIVNIKKEYGLSNEAMNDLLDFSRKDDIGTVHISRLAPLLKAGYSVDDAIKNVQQLKRVVVTFFVTKTEAARVRKTYSKTVAAVALATIQEDGRINVRRGVTAKYNKSVNKYRTGASANETSDIG